MLLLCHYRKDSFRSRLRLYRRPSGPRIRQRESGTADNCRSYLHTNDPVSTVTLQNKPQTLHRTHGTKYPWLRIPLHDGFLRNTVRFIVQNFHPPAYLLPHLRCADGGESVGEGNVVNNDRSIHPQTAFLKDVIEFVGVYVINTVFEAGK